MSDAPRAAGPPSEPDTVTEALSQLVAEGYTSGYLLRDGLLYPSPPEDAAPHCRVGDAVVERMFRFEGPSDPGDEMVVFGIRDPHSGVRGTLVSAFGPAADPEVLDQLTYLASRVDTGRANSGKAD